MPGNSIFFTFVCVMVSPLQKVIETGGIMV